MPQYSAVERNNKINEAKNILIKKPYFWAIILRVLAIIKQNEKYFDVMTTTFARKHDTRIIQESQAVGKIRHRRGCLGTSREMLETERAVISTLSNEKHGLDVKLREKKRDHKSESIPVTAGTTRTTGTTRAAETHGDVQVTNSLPIHQWITVVAIIIVLLLPGVTFFL